MKVSGVFVGVSRQEDPRVKELTFGHWDARCLHAFFADSNIAGTGRDDSLRLLTNEAATKGNVVAALKGTVADAQQGRAELIVVHLSCHGAPDGTLVLFDTQTSELASTGLPVAEVMRILSDARGLPVVLTLDCCFAGAALGLEESPNRDAFNNLMFDFGVLGRLVGCAAEYGERAYEDRDLGMGIFTYALWNRLLEAQNAHLVVLDAHTWIIDAVRRTAELAQTRGRVQTATAFARSSGTPATILVPRERPNQLGLILPSDLPPVTEDLSSLEAHGLDSNAVMAVRRRLGLNRGLNQLQRDAVSIGGVLRQQSLFVSAPTSGGKTLVAELAILGQQRAGRKSMVLLPLRALAREHARTFRDAYSSLGLRIIESTGDSFDDDDLLYRGQFDVAFMTFEKFSAMLYAHPELKESLGLVVFDELQVIAEGDRGSNLELLLVAVKQWRSVSRVPQVVVLCGELADLAAIQQWLALPVVSSPVRPVHLEEGVLRVQTGQIKWRNRVTGEIREEQQQGRDLPPQKDDRHARRVAAAPAVTSAAQAGKQVMVFCSEKPQARKMAQLLADQDAFPLPAQLLGELSGLDSTTTHRTRELLLELASRGVGLHLADMTEPEREAVERSFRAGELRVLVATSTLGQGVNFPTDIVVFVDTERYNGLGMTSIGSPVYRNIAGRAGRSVVGGPQYGQALLIAKSDAEQRAHWETYVAGPSASLTSSLGAVKPEDLTLLLLRSLSNATVTDLTVALAGTYWAAADGSRPTWRRAKRGEFEVALEGLRGLGLAEQVEPTKWSLSKLGRVAAGFGLGAASVHAVAEAAQALGPLSAREDSMGLMALALLTHEVVRSKCPSDIGSIAPDTARTLAQYPSIDKVVRNTAGSETAENRAHKLSALMMWTQGHTLRDVEKVYAAGSRDEFAAGKFFEVLYGVIRVLPAVGAIAALEQPERAETIRSSARKLRVQLTVGGRPQVAELHRLRLALSRGTCIKLVDLGVVDLSSLERALAEENPEVIGLLSTVEAHRISSMLGDRRRRTRITAPEPQLLLTGFD